MHNDLEMNLRSDALLRFEAARRAVLSETVTGEGIGTLSEKSLHKILKLYIEPDTACHEIRHECGSIVDIMNSDGIYEIQTRSYEKLLPKLSRILPTERVTVVCPLAAEKSVRWINKASGEISEGRKSPKREGIYDAFKMLFGIRAIMPHENLTVRLVYLKVEEYKYLSGRGKDGKRGASRMERIPTSIIAEEELCTLSDYVQRVPDTLPIEFTAAEFSSAIRRSSRYSFYALKMLESAGAIREVGKRGRARTSSRADI